MTHSDPISDMLARIKNAAMRKKKEVSFQASKTKLEIARILKENGFIDSFEVKDEDGKMFIVLTLRYIGQQSAIFGLKKISKPGQRLYTGYKKIKLGGKSNQISIISTAKGLMTAKEARKQQIGGELICTIW